VVLLLSAVSGFVDGLAYLRFGVFVANMSGNVILLGLGAGGALPQGWLVLVSTTAFAVGAGVGIWVRALGRRRGAREATMVPVLLQCLLLLAVTVGSHRVPAADLATWWPYAAVVMLAVMNGVQAFVVVQIGSMRTPTTYATGALVTAASSGVAATLDRATPEGSVWRHRFLVAATTPLGYFCGALAFALLRDWEWSLLLPLAAMVAVAVVTWRSAGGRAR
jgi:uncharacterized membrane protein YoaK (UPF0700 family)